MTQSYFSLGGRFSRLWGRPTAISNRTWSIGGARTNPDLRGLNQSQNMLDQLIAALRRRRIRRQWESELRTLNDRQLRDIGISRADAEKTIERLRFWI